MTSREEVRALLGVDDGAAVAGVWGSFRGVVDGVLIRSITVIREGRDAMPCLFLTPTTPAPWPGAVAVHQHNDQHFLGKSEPAGLAGDPTMRYGLELCKRGIAVLIPDLTGFEQRRGPWASDHAFEQFIAMNLLVEGSCLQARHIEDVSAAVSWLTAQAEVTGPLGMIGHSLGGQVSFFATACDARIQASVVHCGFGSIESFRTMNVLHNPGWYVPGMLGHGGTEGVASAIVNQSVLVSAATDDTYFPLWGVRDAVRGFRDGVATLRVFDGSHGMPAAELERSVDWLAARLRESVSPRYSL